jgi:hypothetical protein
VGSLVDLLFDGDLHCNLLRCALALVLFQQLYGNPHHHNNRSSSLRFSLTQNLRNFFQKSEREKRREESNLPMIEEAAED